jgi:hypothetical protein
VSENTGLLSSLFGGGDGNFDSVNTSSATIGGIGEDLPFEQFFADDSLSASETVSIQNDGYDTIALRLSILITGAQEPLTITINNDTNNKYTYENTDGSFVTGSNSIQLVNPNADFCFTNGWVIVTSGGDNFKTVNSRLSAPVDRRGELLDNATYENRSPVSSMEITLPSNIDPNADSSFIEAYGWS